MRNLGWIVAAAVLVVSATACNTENKMAPVPGSDSGVPDAGLPDSGVPDSGVPDSGTPDSGTPDAGTAMLTISGFAFNPADFTVSPGTVITVMNSDSVTHTVTSETADNAFSPGAVNGVSFDTGDIAPGASAQITIPGDAGTGTVIPYFCKIHTSGMSPANGHITVQ